MPVMVSRPCSPWSMRIVHQRLQFRARFGAHYAPSFEMPAEVNRSTMPRNPASETIRFVPPPITANSAPLARDNVQSRDESWAQPGSQRTDRLGHRFRIACSGSTKRARKSIN